MNVVEIYSKAYCPFCQRAKALLFSKQIEFQEYEISIDVALQQQMRKRSGRHTVPQIFVNNQHIGGSDELAEANAKGELDELLGLTNTVIAR